MGEHVVEARPERTQSEITADQQEAEAFFARLNSPLFRSNSLIKFLRIETTDHHAYMAVRESREWQTRTETPKSNRRRQPRTLWMPGDIGPRDDSQLRHYVALAIKATLPVPAIHRQSEEELQVSKKEAAAWWRNGLELSPSHAAYRIRQASVPFQHWLLEHPDYGITDQNAPITVSRDEHRWFRYIPGEIRPAGMTPERALDIALTVLNSRGGTW
jgi:hypothetical protein